MQQSFNEDRVIVDKGYKIFQVLYKDLKLSMAARWSADNSTCLHLDGF